MFTTPRQGITTRTHYTRQRNTGLPPHARVSPLVPTTPDSEIQVYHPTSGYQNSYPLHQAAKYRFTTPRQGIRTRTHYTRQRNTGSLPHARVSELVPTTPGSEIQVHHPTPGYHHSYPLHQAAKNRFTTPRQGITTRTHYTRQRNTGSPPHARVSELVPTTPGSETC